MEEPSIELYMTVSPHTIGQHQPLSDARELMRTLQIRHLPVLDGQKLVGLVSQRDLASFGDAEPTGIEVRVAMRTPVYSVSPKDTVREVAMHMAAHRYGSAVVVEDGQVIGIFTAVDGLVGFSLLLKQLLEASR